MSFFDQNNGIGGLLGGQDYSARIQQALAENAAAPKKKGFDWEEALIGFFAPQAAAMRQRTKLADREREMESSEWYKREMWKRDNPEPTEPPAIAREIAYWNANGRPDMAADVEAKHRMVPVSEADPVTGEVRYKYVSPSQLGGGASQSAELPTINSAADAARLPPGTKFRAPDGSIRTVPGGASPSGSPTF